MHDTKLLSDNDPERTATVAQRSSAIRSASRAPSRTNVWMIASFCVVGLVCSLFVPASYLHVEQSSAVTAEAPQS